MQFLDIAMNNHATMPPAALIALALVCSWLLRVLALRRRAASARPAGSAPVCTMAVLGSGGHTAEMVSLLKTLDAATYGPLLYVIAKSDTTSAQKIETFESSIAAAAPATAPPRAHRLLWVPRSREVGQSYVTSLFTTLFASVYSALHVLRTRPSLLLCNGPGTCIPIAAAALAMRWLGLKHIPIVYVESICRVQSLSLSGEPPQPARRAPLRRIVPPFRSARRRRVKPAPAAAASGKIMLHIADDFLVQWPQLTARYPRTRYIGRLC